MERPAARFGGDGELLQTIELFGGDIFGIDWNERFAAPRGEHHGAKLLEYPRQDIAPHRRMLIDEHPEPGETAAIKAVEITTDVSLLRGAFDRWQLERRFQHAGGIER